MPKGLLRSGITAAFDQDLWQALQITPGQAYEIDNTVRMGLNLGLIKGSQGTPGLPAAISAEKQSDGSIVLLTKIVNFAATGNLHWLKLDGSNANQTIDIGSQTLKTTGQLEAAAFVLGPNRSISASGTLKVLYESRTEHEWKLNDVGRSLKLGPTSLAMDINGQVSLGSSSKNFKDLYLSRNITMGGSLVFTGSGGFYPRRINQAAQPTSGTGATQIDTDEMLIWRKTGDGVVRIVYNDTTSGVKEVVLG